MCKLCHVRRAKLNSKTCGRCAGKLEREALDPTVVLSPEALQREEQERLAYYRAQVQALMARMENGPTLLQRRIPNLDFVPAVTTTTAGQRPFAPLFAPQESSMPPPLSTSAPTSQPVPPRDTAGKVLPFEEGGNFMSYLKFRNVRFDGRQIKWTFDDGFRIASSLLPYYDEFRAEVEGRMAHQRTEEESVIQELDRATRQFEDTTMEE